MVRTRVADPPPLPRPTLLLCDHGLANRLRALVQAVAARGMSGARRVDMVWGPSLAPHGLGLAGCGGNSNSSSSSAGAPCPFSSLFEPVPAWLNVSVIEAGSAAEAVALLRAGESSHEVQLNNCGDVPARTSASRVARLYATLFRPVAPLRRRVHALVARHGLQRCTGLHVRGTDLATIKRVRALAPDGNHRALLFRAFAGRILDALGLAGRARTDGAKTAAATSAAGAAAAAAGAERACFYLATDDPAMQSSFRCLFARPEIAARAVLIVQRELSPPPAAPPLTSVRRRSKAQSKTRPDGGGGQVGGPSSSGRGRASSLDDALVDAYALAHCRALWGTTGSSFSTLAVRLRARTTTSTVELLPATATEGQQPPRLRGSTTGAAACSAALHTADSPRISRCGAKSK